MSRSVAVARAVGTTIGDSMATHNPDKNDLRRESRSIIDLPRDQISDIIIAKIGRSEYKSVTDVIRAICRDFQQSYSSRKHIEYSELIDHEVRIGRIIRSGDNLSLPPITSITTQRQRSLSMHKTSEQQPFAKTMMHTDHLKITNTNTRVQPKNNPKSIQENTDIPSIARQLIRDSMSRSNGKKRIVDLHSDVRSQLKRILAEANEPRRDTGMITDSAIEYYCGTGYLVRDGGMYFTESAWDRRSVDQSNRHDSSRGRSEERTLRPTLLRDVRSGQTSSSVRQRFSDKVPMPQEEWKAKLAKLLK
jgi:hypothetical protein